MLTLVATLYFTSTALAPPVRSGASCASLFGNQNQRTKNGVRRGKKLHQVREDDYAIDIAYSGDWALPSPIKFKDIELVDVLGDKVIVSVSPSLARSSRCAPGRYVIAVDDKLGKRNSVLAVLDHALLLEREGRLYYLAKDEQEPILFRMTWRADFRLPRSRATASVSVPPAINMPRR